MNIHPIRKTKVINIDEETYRNYRVIYYFKQDLYIGEIYKKNLLIARCKALEIASALQNSRSMVDSLIRQKVCDKQNTAPVPRQLTEALTDVIPLLSHSQYAILLYQVMHRNKDVELDKLKRVAACNSTTEIYFILAEIARAVCDELAYVPPSPLGGGDPFLALILESETGYANTENSIKLKLRTTFFNALRSIKWQ